MSPTILNVNDDAARRYVITRVLRQGGLDVIEAGTGQEAADLALSVRPAVVVLDVKLPDIDGITVCERIKTDPRTAGTGVVLSSAILVEDADRVRGLEIADAYLAEPVAPAVLVATVKALARVGVAEAALRESEASYRLLFESSPLPAWVVDGDRATVLAVNEAACLRYGYAREELVGTSILTVFAADDVPSASAWLSVEPGAVIAARQRTKDGTVVDVELEARALTYAGRRARLVVAHDITERRRREAERVELLAARRMEEVASSLLDVGRRVMATWEVGARADTIAGALIPIFHVRRAVLYTLDAGGRALRCIAARGDIDLDHCVGQVLGVPGSLTGRAVTERRPRSSADAVADDLPLAEWAKPYIEPDCHAWVTVPLVAGDETLGALALGDTTGRRFRDDEVQLLSVFAGQAALGLRNARLYDALRESRQHVEAVSRRLLDVQEVEQRRLARELHDEMGGALSALKLELQALDRRAQPGDVKRDVAAAAGAADGLLQRLRQVSLDLRPSLLDDYGLEAAIRWYVDRQAQRAGLEMSVVSELRDARFPAQLETALYRVVQAAVTNVVRHARARRLTVELRRRGDALAVAVRDDGVGFDVDACRERARRGQSLGLLVMEERAVLAGGDLELESSPGHGSEVRATFPLEPVAPGQPERRSTTRRPGLPA